MRHRSLGLLAVIALMLAGCGAGVAEPGGPSEGIQVHGDWTVSVYNEDGTLDEHREFSNALTFGAEALTYLLGGEAAFGYGEGPYVQSWGIVFGAAPGTSPCDIAIPRSANPDFSYGCGIDPTVTRSADGDTLTLSGSTQVTQDASVINWVETAVLGLGGPEAGTYGWSKGFTGTAIPDQSVSAGQTVQIEVEISFTSG